MRNCIIILNLPNLTGTLNHAIKNLDGSFSKIRVDYKALLEYNADGRNILGAYCISQNDISSNLKSKDSRDKNKKFLSNLATFGWTPISIDYDRSIGDMEEVKNNIWIKCLESHCDDSGTFKYDTQETDIIFITGSSTWEPVVRHFYENNFPVEISYIKKCTSKILEESYAFADLSNFIINQYNSNKKDFNQHVSK